jgi:hypothetical protein
MPGEVCAPAVQAQLQDREEFLLEVRERLEQAQQQYKHFYDRRYREISFDVGQWVWLRLLHRPLALLDIKGQGKLGPKFYGPFLILEKIGDVAYRLKLPVGTKLHDVFHVGLLKPFKGEPPTATPAIPPVWHGRACTESEIVLHGRLAWGCHELLVQWKGLPAAKATWIDLAEFQHLYPSFQPTDELLTEGGGGGGRDAMI